MTTINAGTTLIWLRSLVAFLHFGSGLSSHDRRRFKSAAAWARIHVAHLSACPHRGDSTDRAHHRLNISCRGWRVRFGRHCAHARTHPDSCSDNWRGWSDRHDRRRARLALGNNRCHCVAPVRHRSLSSGTDLDAARSGVADHPRHLVCDHNVASRPATCFRHAGAPHLPVRRRNGFRVLDRSYERLHHGDVPRLRQVPAVAATRFRRLERGDKPGGRSPVDGGADGRQGAPRHSLA